MSKLICLVPYQRMVVGGVRLKTFPKVSRLKLTLGLRGVWKGINMCVYVRCLDSGLILRYNLIYCNTNIF